MPRYKVSVIVEGVEAEHAGEAEGFVREALPEDFGAESSSPKSMFWDVFVVAHDEPMEGG